MKFVIAATFAAAASAGLADDLVRASNEVDCGLWKSGVAINKNLTAETDSNNNTTYYDDKKVIFTQWSS